MSDSFLVDYVRLARTTRITDMTFYMLLDAFKTPTNIIESLPNLLLKKEISLISKEDAEKEIELTKKHGAKIITSFDQDYPKILKLTQNRPALLVAKGNSELLNRDVIAVIGTRNPSINSRIFTRKIVSEIASNDIVIASGLARGIDTESHFASIDHGTIGVIAGGIDNIYPPENKDLYNQMYEKGVVITEEAFGTSPKSTNFPKRNRIISGISLGILVIEASREKSGTLITVRIAKEQSRVVFAVPGFPGDESSIITNKLIKEGAIMVTSSQDILQKIAEIKRVFGSSYSGLKEDDDDFAFYKTAILDDIELAKVRKVIMNNLGTSPVNKDEFVRLLSIPINLANVALIQLALWEKIEMKNGMICKIAEL